MGACSSSILAVKPCFLHVDSPARCLCARYQSAPRQIVSSCFDPNRFDPNCFDPPDVGAWTSGEERVHLPV